MTGRHLLALCMSCVVLCSCGNPVSTGNNAVSSTEQATTETVTADTQTMDSDTALTIDNYHMTIHTLTETNSYYSSTSPNVRVLESDASYPYFTLKDRPDASDKINAAIEKELSTFRNFEKENSSYADEDYKLSLDQDAQEAAQDPFSPYSASFSYTLKRCDDRIISIVFSQYDDTNGAHGTTWNYGVTFDSTTGDRLYLESLSDDGTSFYQMLASELNEQMALPAYENYIFQDLSTDAENSLLKDTAAWYFDSSGITFISNAYVLGPYAAGTFEFNIPYADLSGLKKAYAYKGSYIRKLFPGIQAACDLNGDGKTEELCYSIETGENFSELKPSLTINGIEESSAIRKLNLKAPLTGAYYLIDVDPEDSYIEIAVCDEGDSDSSSYTHFFRYGTDGRLTYVGNLPGVLQEGDQVHYNANGNLLLCDRNGDPLNR